MSYCNQFNDSDYLNRLRNEKRKQRNAERTAVAASTRRAVADHYSELRA